MPDRTKVLVLIKGLGLGGAEKLLAMSLPYLDRECYEYEFGYLLPWKNLLVEEFTKANLPVFCFDQKTPFDPRVIWRIARAVRERNIDIIHVHLPYSGIIGRLVGKLAPVKSVIYTEHNLWERYHPATKLLNKLTYGWNDAVIAVSKQVELSLSANVHINGKPSLRTIVNGIDLSELSEVRSDAKAVKEEFGIPESHKLVIHVANFTPKKRHIDLLKAASIVTQELPNTSFLMVGQGPMWQKTVDEAESLGLTSQVKFTGVRDDVPYLMAASDLFVLSSVFEGLPVSVLEAMALGKPVVATAVGGVPEIITSGVDGLLVEPLNPKALASKIADALGDPHLRMRLGQNAKIRVTNDFDIKHMVEQVETLYQQSLSVN